MVILIAVLGLVVVNAMKHSPWATSTVAATIPIAILVGVYMRSIRPAACSRARSSAWRSCCSRRGRGLIDHHETLRGWFDHDGVPLAWFVIGYGFFAAICQSGCCSRRAITCPPS